MLILKKDDIKKCFTMRDAIEADKEALEIYSEGKAKVPLRTNIDIDKIFICQLMLEETKLLLD